MIQGCDYAWERPDPVALAQAGYRFAVRYLSHDNTGKNLTAAEAKSLHDAGLAVVLNWEYASAAARNGYAQGRSDAANAQNLIGIIGAPARSVVYFSVDFDAQPADFPAISEYFRGCAVELGADRVGAYGGYAVIALLAPSPYALWFWQTYAWSGGRWHDAAHIRQTVNGVRFNGLSIDNDTAMRDHFGQWPDGGNTMALRDDPDFRALIERVKSVADLNATTEDGPTKGESLAIVAQLAKLDAILSQVNANGSALTQVMNTLSSMFIRLGAIEAKMGATSGTLHVSGDLTVG